MKDQIENLLNYLCMFKIIKPGNFMCAVYDDNRLIKIFNSEQKRARIIKNKMHYLCVLIV